MRQALTFFVTLIMAASLHADWTVDTASSSVSFVSVKNGSIVEAHHFGKVAGSVSAAGEASVEVTLDSVDTMIPIRDDRMKTMLFETAEFPLATFTASVPVDEIAAMAAGTSRSFDLAGTLGLHGMSTDITVPVTVISAGAGTYQVSSVKPVLLTAGSFGLEGGIEALREIAGLGSITPVVPVMFSLVFRSN